MIDARVLAHAAAGRLFDTIESTLNGHLAHIVHAAELLWQCVDAGHMVFAVGNGGSAAEAQHFTAELMSKYRDVRDPIPALSLHVDTSLGTAIGNDYGFEKLFSRQIQALGKFGDVLVALTTSGASPNVLNAVTAAREKDVAVILLTGANGAALRGKVDVCIAIPSTETARIQELHLFAIHVWCEYIDAKLKEKSGG